MLRVVTKFRNFDLVVEAFILGKQMFEFFALLNHSEFLFPPGGLQEPWMGRLNRSKF
jgi:hypothetical protein